MEVIVSDIFKFLSDIPPYDENETTLYRLAQRHRLLIDPFRPQIEGARILDLACHDGRWSYALARAGARDVIGVEARAELVERFEHFPDDDARSEITLVCNDLFNELEARAAVGERFDVVAIYGIFYHIMDHFRLLSLVRRMQPGLIIIDSEFIQADNAMIQVLMEEVSNPLNAVTDVPGQTHTVVGVPSQRATEFMAGALGYDITWIDQALILGADRRGMHDYFRAGRKVRHCCALTPV